MCDTVYESTALSFRLQIGQKLVWIRSLFNPASDWRCHFVGVGASARLFHGSFPCASSCFSSGSDRRHHSQTMLTLFTVSGLPPVTQNVDRFFSPLICFLLTTIYSQLAWWGWCWGPSEYSLDRSKPIAGHSQTSRHRLNIDMLNVIS